jgi:hypothetical protein
MCGCWFTLAQNDLMDLMVTLFDKQNLEEKMITMVWNGHHLHSNLPIDQFHMNPCFYHRVSVFHFSEKIFASCNISEEVKPLVATSIIWKQRKTTCIYSLTARSITHHPDCLSLWPSSLC